MPEPKFHQKIAWFNFICCLMVIWTHSGNADLFFPELGQDAPWWHFQYPVMQEILRVDIPCFIMLSAYLFYRNFTMKRLGEKLNKRLHSLLVPYLLWNTIYYVAYVAASRIPGLQTIANRTDLVITPSGAWQAITKYTFNPVFWFMYQIILLVLLAPVLYLFLKNIWTGAAFLLVLLVALFKGVALPELNLDALIYYSFAAYAALHGRKWAEEVWSWKRAALGVCLLAVGIVLSRSYYTHYFVPGIVLYQLLAVIGIWMMVNERWLGEVRPFMTCTFFIYATHFVVVRFLNKAAALLFPGSQLVSMFMYVCMPLLAVTLCYQAARVLRRYRPDIWKTLNGGR